MALLVLIYSAYLTCFLPASLALRLRRLSSLYLQLMTPWSPQRALVVRLLWSRAVGVRREHRCSREGVGLHGRLARDPGRAGRRDAGQGRGSAYLLSRRFNCLVQRQGCNIGATRPVSSHSCLPLSAPASRADQCSGREDGEKGRSWLS